MKKEDCWMHFLDSHDSRFFTVCNIENPKDIATRRFPVPYESQLFSDSVQIANHIYFSGGGLAATPTTLESYLSLMMRFTIQTGMETSVTKLAKMAQPRANHTMVALTPTCICVAGGCNSKGYLSTAEAYQVDKDAWIPLPTLNHAKKWVSLCGFEGKTLYAFGGALSETTQSKEIESCARADWGRVAHWTLVTLASGSSLWHGGFFIGSQQVGTNCILLFGGVVGSQEVSTCLRFDPTTRTMTTGNPLKRTDGFYRSKAGINGNLFAIVGCHDADLHLLDTSTHSWEVTLKTIWNPPVGYAIKSDTI